MNARVQFLGTGTLETRGVLNEGGFLIMTSRGIIAVDPGPGASQALAQAKISEVSEVVVTDVNRGHDQSLLKIASQEHGVEIKNEENFTLFNLVDARVGYVPKKTARVKFSADILITIAQNESLIEKIKPKLAILTLFDKPVWEKNPMYVAREIQKRTGVQTIAAQDGLVVDLSAYGAFSEQKMLEKYQK